MTKKLSLKNTVLVFSLLFSALCTAQVIPFAYTHGFGTPATLPPGMQLVSYDGATNCAATPNGANAVTTMVLKALPGYEFNIRNVSGMGVRNTDGSTAFNFAVINNGTVSGPVTEVPASTNCAGNTPLTPFAVPLENQLVTSGNTITIQAQRHAGATQGTGTSHIKSFVVTGEVRVSTPVATEATGILASGFTATWNPVTNATGYQVDVSTSPDFTTMLPGYDNVSVNGTSLFVAYTLVPGVTYYYRVRAKIQFLGSANSNAISVVAACATVAAPVGAANQSFIEGATLASLQVAGENVVWYADEQLTQPLPADSLLADTVTYYAVAVNGSCMSEPLAVTVNLDLNAPGATQLKIEVFPNPSHGIVTVKNNTIITGVHLYNLMGQEVHSVSPNTAEVQLNVAMLQAGAYLLKVESVTGSRVVKLLKK